MDDSGFYIGDSNDSDGCIRWGKDGTISITGSISGMIQEGVLLGYGPIIITIWHELPEVGARTFLPPQVPPKTTFCINGIPVSEEGANLVSDALKSQAGELTTAGFHPDKVEEILIPNIKVRCETGNLWGGYSNVSEMDEITATVLRKYGPIEIYLPCITISMPKIHHYFINNVEVTPEDADTVWSCLKPQKDTLARGDFVDLDKVERILEKVCVNNAI